MKVYRFGVAAIMIAAMATSVAQAAPIESITANVMGEGTPLPPVLAKRMQAAVQTAAEHIYVGKDTAEVTASAEAYRRVTADIINRILYGYTVDGLTITPGTNGQLNVTVKPYGQVVQQVELEIDYGNLSPQAREMVDTDLGSVRSRIEQTVVGAPLDSVDWVTSIASRTVRDDLADVLPEFVPQISITPGPVTKVKLYLIPQGPVIRQGSSEIESSTLPGILFLTTKQTFDTYMVGWEGVPIAFVTRHERDVLASVSNQLAKSRAVSRFGLVMTPDLLLGTEAVLRIKVDSSKYILRGDGYLDMGHTDRNVGFKAFTGVRQGRGEVYLETVFYPDTYKWEFMPSYAYRVAPYTTLGYQYNVSDHFNRTWIRQDLGERFHVRAQRDWDVKRNEFGLAYDVHSYLTLEYVVDDDNQWLRLIGHL